jgi:hypothetical protein
MSDGSFAALSLKIRIPENASQAQTTATAYDFDHLRTLINQSIMCMNYLIEFREKNAAPSLHKLFQPRDGD